MFEEGSLGSQLYIVYQGSCTAVAKQFNEKTKSYVDVRTPLSLLSLLSLHSLSLSLTLLSQLSLTLLSPLSPLPLSSLSSLSI